MDNLLVRHYTAFTPDGFNIRALELYLEDYERTRNTRIIDIIRTDLSLISSNERDSIINQLDEQHRNIYNRIF